MKFSALLTVLSLTLLASCGGGGGGSNGGSSKSPLSKSGIGNASSDVYEGNCRFDSQLDKYQKTVVTITETEGEPIVTLSDDLFIDSSCSKVKLSLDYPVLNISESDESTIEGDTYSVYFRPRSKEIVKEMNSEAICGIRSWKLNQAQDVSNTSCESSLSGKVTITTNGIAANVKLCPSNQRSCVQFFLHKK